MGGVAVGERPHRDFPLPEMLVPHARSWLAGGTGAVVPAKPSATVMLLRAGAGGPELFVLRRATTMAFAPDMLAFPGGGVDRRDTDPGLPWAGPSPQEWADRVGAPTDRARELVVAAAREVFEECGVLLAGPDAGTVVDNLTDPVWDTEREALLDRTQSFAELLIRRDLVLRTDLLALRAHWTTPECEPRRYDTRFFVARLPEGQVADDRSSETAMARWDTPAALLESHRSGAEIMLPPTRVMIEQLARAADLEQALAPAAQVHHVMPWPVERDGALWMRCPVDAEGHGLRP